MQYADENGTYKPDFVLEGDIFVEIKSEVVPGGTLERMHTIRSTHPHATLWVVVGHWISAKYGYMFETAMRCSPQKLCSSCASAHEDTRPSAKARATLAEVRGPVKQQRSMPKGIELLTEAFPTAIFIEE